jgi:hypothetical protein
MKSIYIIILVAISLSVGMKLTRTTVKTVQAAQIKNFSAIDKVLADAEQ